MEIEEKTYYALINTIYGVRYVVVKCKALCVLYIRLAKRENKEYNIR